MRTTVVMNIKGGVGKTVTTINMAAELAAHEQRVLIVDADPQCNLSEFCGGNTEGCTLEDVLTGGGRQYLPGLLQQTQMPGVDLLAGSDRLFLSDISALRGQGMLDNVSEFLLSLAEDDAYDFVLIDTPPSFTAATCAALAAADDVIIPMRLDAFSIAGVKTLLLQVKGMRDINPEISVAGVLITQYDGTIVAKETADAMRESALPVFGTVVRRTTAVDRSTFDRKPLREEPGTYARRCAEEYADVVKEYLKGGAKRGF